MAPIGLLLLGVSLALLLVLPVLIYAGGRGAGHTLDPPPSGVFILGLFVGGVLGAASVAVALLDLRSGAARSRAIARRSIAATVACAVSALLIASLSPGAVTAFDGTVDFERDLDLGIRSSGSTVTAPLSIARDFTGFSRLNWLEANSTNREPVSVSLYFAEDFNAMNESSNRDRALATADNVTYFWFSFATLEVRATPAANATPAATVSGRFAGHAGDPSGADYMLVLERRELDPATVHFSLDRISASDAFLGSGYGAFVWIAAALGAGHSMAAVDALRRRSSAA